MVLKASDLRPGDVIFTRSGVARIVTATDRVNGDQVALSLAMLPLMGDPEPTFGALFDAAVPVVCVARNYPLGGGDDAA